MDLRLQFIFYIALLIVKGGAFLLPTKPPQHIVNVTTDCGLVMGVFNTSYVFRGIPYALPPTGSRRWQEPVPMSRKSGHCWTGVKRAFQFGSACTQMSGENVGYITGSEDCLFLNVWTPTVNTQAELPVMVFIHGGSLQASSGNAPKLTPTEEIAKDTNMVYVSMNYRLSAFGFMALDILSEASPSNTSGNYGFMDQIAALQWVQTNIRNFGGDPTQVTVFGQSSGGTSVFALLASPLAAGLFSKAMMLSASSILNKTTADASRDNLLFLNNTGCSDITCLHHLPAKEIMLAIPLDVYPYWSMTDQTDLPTNGHFDGAIAVVDGYVLPDPPLVAWQKGKGVDVPLIIGTTAQEIDIGPGPTSIKSWDWTQYRDRVSRKLATFSFATVTEALKYYPMNVETPELQFTSMVSDIRVNCPNDIVASVANRNFKSPVYRYVATAFPSQPISFLPSSFAASYSFHIWDLFALFGTIKYYINPLSGSDLKFQNNIQKELTSFAKTGKPFSMEWKTFETSTLLLSDTLQIATRYHEVECDYWMNQTNFWPYAWIN